MQAAAAANSLNHHMWPFSSGLPMVLSLQSRENGRAYGSQEPEAPMRQRCGHDPDIQTQCTHEGPGLFSLRGWKWKGDGMEFFKPTEGWKGGSSVCSPKPGMLELQGPLGVQVR